MKGAKSLNLLLTFCLFTATSLYGQASYYYYGNKRIDLEDVPGRSFILLNAEDTSSFLQLLSETASQQMLLNKIFLSAGSLGNVTSSEYCWSTINTRDLPSNFQNYVYKSYNYRTLHGDMVTPSHLFYVKLKRAEDISLLESWADSMRVSIVDNNSFMPLWYILSCNQHSVGNALKTERLDYSLKMY